MTRRLGRTLDAVRARCDVAVRIEADPVSIVRRYTRRLDQEIVGLAASAVAFGNAKAFRAKLEDALERLGPDVAAALDDDRGVFAKLHGWKHRMYRGEDLARLLIGARRVQRASGSLGHRFAADLAGQPDLRHALAAFTGAIRQAGGLGSSKTAAHLLADPMASSACKRLLLYLRWMVRPADGVDLGLWNVSPSALLMPVDTHIHRLALNLGLTRRRTASWAAAEEITGELRRFDPDDPVKYDFALCHLGMVRHCPSRRDTRRCEGCGVRPVCRHWGAGRAKSRS
jgi:uncharacterized protein (TIGR02757 family)